MLGKVVCLVAVLIIAAHAAEVRPSPPGPRYALGGPAD